MEFPKDRLYFRDLHPVQILGFLLLAILTGWLLGNIVIYFLSLAGGWNLLQGLPSLTEQSRPADRNVVRLALLTSHLSLFIVPAILTAYLFYKNGSLQALKLERWPRLQNLFMGMMLLLLAFPLVQLSYWFNQQIPLPDWMVSIEDSTNDMIKNLLISEAGYELPFNLLVIAVLPALGEELVFRGFVQQQLTKYFKSPVAGIWLAAIIFSLIHFQFQGFIPRALLGALLGYLYFWTGNLWVPIVAHFFNNAAQLIAQHLFMKDVSELDLDNIEHIPWGAGLFSLATVLVIAFLIRQYNAQAVDKV